MADFDPRIEYLSQITSHLLACSYQQASQALDCGETHGFMDGDSNEPLIVFILDNKLVVQSYPPEECIPVVIFTRRRDDTMSQSSLASLSGKSPSSEQIHDFSLQLCYQYMMAQPLEAIEQDLSVFESFLPQESELEFESRKLSISAQTTLQQLNSNYSIAVPDDLVVNQHQDSQLSTKLIEEVSIWLPTLQKAYEEYNELKHNSDEPMEEIELWRHREALISTLYENLQTNDFKQISQALEKIENPAVQEFLELRLELSQLCLEARDNTRFLSTLERHFKLLQKAPLQTLPDVISSLFSAIRMVWTISRYFNTEEKLLPLLEKIALELCKRVESSIYIDKLFCDSSTNQKQILSDSLCLLEKWETCYFETRQQIENFNKEARRWEFDKNVLFGRTEFVKNRIEKLYNCLVQIEEFEQITSSQVQKVTGDISGVMDVKKMVAELPADLVQFGDAIFQADKSAEFAEILQQFDKNVEKTYTSGFLFIDNSFLKLNSVQQALEFNYFLQNSAENNDAQDAAVKSANPAAQHSLAEHMRGKTEDIIKKYVSELRRTYQEFLDKNQHPPIGCDLPRVAGTLVWCRSLYAAVRAPMDIIRRMDAEIQKLSATKEANEQFTQIQQSLKAFEKETFAAWKQEADLIIMRSLSSPLLGEKPVFDIETLRREENQEISVPPVSEAQKNVPDALKSDDSTQYISPSVSCLILRRFKTEMCVNFPFELNELIDEVKILDRLGFSVGETALNVALQKQKYEKHAEGLKELIFEVNTALEKFLTPEALEDAQSGDVSTAAAQLLIEKAVAKAAIVIRPGFGPLNWNSLSVDDYLERALSAASELQQVSQQLLKTIGNVEQNIKFIKNSKLVPSELMLFQGSELSYAAANPTNLVGISIDPEKYKNLPPEDAMRAAARDMEIKAASQNEKMFEELESLTILEFSQRLEEFRSREVTQALEKYSGLTQLLNKIEENAFGNIQARNNTRLEKYFKFWAGKVFNALIQMVNNALRDFYLLIRGITTNNKDISPKFLKHDYTPLFNLEITLGSDPQSTPSIEEIRNCLNVEVEAIGRVAEPFILWEDGSVKQFKYESSTSVKGAEILKQSDATTLRKSELFEFRKQGLIDDSGLSEEVVVRSFHIQVINEESVTSVIKDTEDKIEATLEQVDNYILAWKQFEDLYKTNRQNCIEKFSEQNITASEFDYLLEFFKQTREALESGKLEKTFILNTSKRTEKPDLLTTLAEGPSLDPEETDDNKNLFIYDQKKCFKVPEDCNLLKAVPISGNLSSMPPYRAVIGFCIVEGYQIVETIEQLCILWQEGIMRLVIERVRPDLLELYENIDQEIEQSTEECQTIDQLKAVLQSIVRIQQNVMNSELKEKQIQEFYRLCYLYDGVIDTPNQVNYRNTAGEVIDTVKIDIQEYKIESQSDYINDIAEIINFGYSYKSIHKFLQQCETFTELCNVDIEPLAAVEQESAAQNTTLELNFLTGKHDREKKTFKTVNCKIYKIEFIISKDLRRKYDSLQILAGLIDESLDSTKKKFSDVTAKQSKEFEKTLNTFITEFKETGPMLPITNYYQELAKQQIDPNYALPKSISETLDSVTDIYTENKAKLDSMIKEKDKTLLAEKLFNQEPISCAKLPAVERDMEKFGTILEVYNIVKETYQEWDRIPFAALNASQLDSGCDELLQKLAKIGLEYKHHKCYELVETMILQYKESIPLLEDLTNKALRPRHWSKLEEVCEQQIFSGNENQNLTLGQITSLDLSKFKDDISDIVVGAVKEQQIELDIAKIASIWTQTRLPIQKFKSSQGKERGYVLRNLDDIMSIIEDNSMTLQSMSSSKYVAFFTNDVRLWEKRLGVISDVLDAWMQYERQWLYLEGIFAGSDDLRIQLPDEAKRFDRIDMTFIKLMTEIGKSNPNVLDACIVSGRQDMIRQQIASMDQCQKALTDYLNSKRSQYQRFYFISDDELLSILGSASNPTSVQEHMRKMFDNVSSLEFQRGTQNVVIGMNSPEGEQLLFVNELKIESNTPIEKWMTQIDQQMKESLRIQIKTGIYDYGANYTRQQRSQWVKKYLCQVCMVSAEVFNTWDIEEAFRVMSGEQDDAEAHNAMKTNLERKSEQITELVLEVRTDLSKQERIKVNTMLIVDIHHQTLLDDLIKNNVVSKTDFNYESQLRFYYLAKSDTLQILQNTPPSHPYLYEYLGLSGRLVVTPLMDRLNMTITTALNKGYFCNPQGKAGTGKTEGVKDLAKQLGRMCVVINCSEGVDVKSIGSIFSGACESGCWICFDEFNRIQPAILSVVSSEVKQILSAMRGCTAPENSREIPSTKFVFEGREIIMRSTAAAFCTMNPGYAGRSELPDNLKALFRPVVMQKPDLNIICENMLFSEGFVTARLLSQKMVVLYKLASEELSKQYHYDFGLRALKSVLVNAGKLKRQNPEENEERLLMKALVSMNLPKFVFEDVPLFMGLITDLCPGIRLEDEAPQREEAPGEEILTMAIAAEHALRAMEMEVIQDQVRKVCQLNDTLGIRHSVMLVGPTSGGKTVIRNAYARAMTEMKIATTQHVINPKAIPVDELYGVLDKDTREWQDGLFSKMFRQLNSSDNVGNGKILNICVFDGFVDSLWVESLNSLQDDSKLLTLANNERIRLLDNCKLLFEVGDLQYASPATVSRSGMVWVDSKNLGYMPVFARWVAKRFNGKDNEQKVDLTEARNNATQIFNKYVPELVDYIYNGVRINSSSGEPEIVGELKLAMPVTDVNLVNEFCKLFDDIIDKSMTNVDTQLKYQDDIVLNPIKFSVLNDAVVLEALFLFCITWSIGSCVDERERVNFDSYLRELSGLPMKSGVATNETVSASHFPGGIITSAVVSGIGGEEQSTLYDYYFDLRREVWCPWSAFLEPYEPLPNTSFANIVVQTEDTIRNSWILDTFIEKQRNVLFVGESGTAKTTIVKNYLRGIDADQYNTLSMNFSSRTGSAEVEAALEDNLEKRLKDLGPPAGKKLIFFIDEISMPRIDQYGTEQPIALLKLFVEKKGIYDKKTLTWKKVIDVQTCGCLPTPGGSHNLLDPRFVSHFCSLNITTPTEDVLTHIYSSILSSHLKAANFQFDLSDIDANYKMIDNFSKKLTTNMLAVYESLLAALSPTPSRFHYLFNLRDLSRVYEGMTFATPDKFSSTSELLKLWRNEFLRIFHDRLICQEDKDIVQQKVASYMNENFGDIDSLDAILDGTLIYGDFREMPKMLENMESVKNGVEAENICIRSYEELIEGEPEYRQLQQDEDHDEQLSSSKLPENEGEKDASPYSLTRKLAELALDEYNNWIKPPLHGIVLFDGALAHLLRLHKILRTPRGCSLLVGYGGSGRRSLTRLATFMAGYELFEITLAKNYTEQNFKDDLKELYKRLAPPQNAGKQITFLFTDQHIADESFLEAINSILTTGIVPALFTSEEKEQYINNVREQAVEHGCAETKDALWSYFINSCRERLHIVLSMSPVGELLRQRCRSFPGLVSQCVIDWYEAWNDEDLRTVAKHSLTVTREQPIEIVDNSVWPDRPSDQLQELKVELFNSVVEHVLYVHKTSVELSDEFWGSIRRRNYVTPRNFVDFLSNYLKILSSKRQVCNQDIEKFHRGLEKLSQAKTEVDAMQLELEDKKVVLDEKTEACQAILVKIEAQTAETNALQEQANAKNEELSKQKAEIEVNKKEAEQELEAAMPALEAAELALQNLNPAEIAELRTLKVASAVVVQVFGCVYALRENINNPVDWDKSKALLADLRGELKNFDKSKLTQKSINYTKSVTKQLTSETVQKSSGAALCIYDWIISMQKYYEVAKDVEPKKKKVKEAEAALEKATKELDKITATLQQLNIESAQLKEKLQAAEAEQQDLEEEATLMAKRLDAAQRLISGLGTEKVRWAATAEKLVKIERQYVGDCLITAAMMSYSGGFTYDFRAKLIEKWVEDCSDKKIPISLEYDEKNEMKPYRPELLLTNDVEILKWGSEGLPSDELSVMNGVMVTKSAKWPLIIDPQLLSVRWIKEKEKSSQLVVRTENDDDFLKQLENCIQYGRPFLLDNVGESIDPILTSVLEKDVRQKGNSQKTVKLGDKDIDYDSNFRLYLTTKLFNPILPPDIFSTLSVINHCVTETGLEPQLLNVVVKRERPDIEQEREKLVKTMASANDTLKQEEEKLLVALSTAQGNIVDNTDLITTLEKAKSKALEVSLALDSMKITAEETELAREEYQAVARRGRVCYFTMAGLSAISPMYEYSLQAFNEIFAKSLTEATSDTNVEEKIKNIIEKLTDNVYQYVCTSLFESHKLMFSFMLTTNIIQAEKSENCIPFQELDFFTKGDTSLDDCPISNPHSWISTTGWKDLIKLSVIFKNSELNEADPDLIVGSVKQFLDKHEDDNLQQKYPTITSEIFVDLINDITNNDKEWKRWWDDERPEILPLPGKIGQNPFVTDMQKLCILRCLRSDRVYIAISAFVSNILGEKYTIPPVLNYDYIYKESTRSTPVLFIITPGSDPLNEIMELAKKHDFLNSRFKYVALGEGQSPIAENLVKTGISRGEWVLLMNAHLLPNWLKELEKIMEPVMSVEELIEMESETQEEEDGTIIENVALQNLNKSVNEDFRLFLTTEPTEQFPLSILENSIKIVTEPPNSLRLNILQTFSKIEDEQFNECPSEYFKPLIYALSFFHASIEERAGKYGKLGFNVKYDFNDSDFSISMDVINTYLTKSKLSNEEVPWASIRYLIGEVNYGGRVMDDWDRRLVNCYLNEYFGDFLFDEHQKFSFYRSKTFAYELPPIIHIDNTVNENISLNKAISDLINESFDRYGGPEDRAEFIENYTKDNQSLKEVYEQFFISKIPIISSPMVFGMHSNAEISYLENATREVWQNLAELQPRQVSQQTISKEDYLLQLCKTLEARVPVDIDYLATKKKFKLPEPTDIVLLQEIERFNILLSIMRQNIEDLERALIGEIGMSYELDQMSTQLFIGQLPANWREYCPATLKPLSGWMQHLQERYEEYKKWISLGEPAVIWLSGLHIPESYLTALVQTCSRIKKWPLDRSALFTEVTSYEQASDIKTKLEFGTYIEGLFIEGASWSIEKECLVNSKQKELMVQLPLLRVIPAEASRIKLRNQFKAPVYVTTARTNAMGVGLVFAADLASYEHESLWILQGVAVLLNDN